MRFLVALLRGVLAMILLALLGINIWRMLSVHVLQEDLADIAGYFVLDMRDDSMHPSIEKDSAVLLQPHENYEMGAVVAFRAADGVQVRRLVGKCGTAFITRGDFMPQEDDALLPYESILGEAVLHIPQMGLLLVFFEKISCTVFLTALFLILVVFLPMLLRKQGAGTRYG